MHHHHSGVAETELEVICDITKPGDELYVTGEWISWSTEKAVKLSTSPTAFPLWSGSIQALYLTGTEYKYFVKLADGSLCWEALQESNNRFFNGNKLVREVYNQFNSQTANSEVIPLGLVGKSQFRVLKASYSNRTVAMKAIPLSTHFAVRQASTEAQMLALLHDCRYTVTGVRSFITEDQTYVILEEYLPNGSLFTALYKQKLRFNTIQRLRILMHVAAALDFMHKKGYMHRDVKSPNILLDSSYGAKLCDFGIAKKEEELCSREGTLNSPRTAEKNTNNSSPASRQQSPQQSQQQQQQQQPASSGSPAWMAPEIFARKPHNRFADIYSLGVVMYEVMEATHPPRRRLYPEDISLSNPLAPLISACLHPDPFCRPSARRIKAELRSLIAELCRFALRERGRAVDHQSILEIYNSQKANDPLVEGGVLNNNNSSATTGNATTIATTSPNSQLTRRNQDLASSPALPSKHR
eukprot:TRINITY_DN6162_c0_g1_i1.p1 TRINITY_DN6162_c0_g1~~TRINITY_DN6162_c0_g1_i1.p1  ORF type:complete len:470 (+),score=100.28 TRINITY_DN6162_c0_g1_i1:132-1541(+)